jgi:hypothetical protein
MESLTPLQPHTQLRQYTRKIPPVRPKLAAHTFASHPWHNSKANPKDSHRSIKWQPQEQINLQWTKHHLDSYLALAEVICEWNIDPG